MELLALALIVLLICAMMRGTSAHGGSCINPPKPEWMKAPKPVILPRPIDFERSFTHTRPRPEGEFPESR